MLGDKSRYGNYHVLRFSPNFVLEYTVSAKSVFGCDTARTGFRPPRTWSASRARNPPIVEERGSGEGAAPRPRRRWSWLLLSVPTRHGSAATFQPCRVLLSVGSIAAPEPCRTVPHGFLVERSVRFRRLGSARHGWREMRYAGSEPSQSSYRVSTRERIEKPPSKSLFEVSSRKKDNQSTRSRSI
jgi:hypothetical protein